MKTQILISTIALFMTSLSVPASSLGNQVEQTGKKILSAFKHESFTEYAQWTPTLEQFHQMMNQNASVYGSFLNDAKIDFSVKFEKQVKPTIYESFSRALSEGINHSIDWKNIVFVNSERTQDLLLITFTSRGKTFRMSVLILEIDGEIFPTRFHSFL